MEIQRRMDELQADYRWGQDAYNDARYRVETRAKNHQYELMKPVYELKRIFRLMDTLENLSKFTRIFQNTTT